MDEISTIDQLEQLYGDVARPSVIKETEHLTAEYQAIIQASPFFVLASSGRTGLDCSPRGDQAGFVRVQDKRTLMVPDRRGNNRIDTLRNIVEDPRVALLFLVPGMGETLRVNGTATIHANPELLREFSVGDKIPRTVIRVSVKAAYFQCSRAVLRSKLWSTDAQVDRASLPSCGTILGAIESDLDGEAYDEALPERLRTTLY